MFELTLNSCNISRTDIAVLIEWTNPLKLYNRYVLFFSQFYLGRSTEKSKSILKKGFINLARYIRNNTLVTTKRRLYH